MDLIVLFIVLGVVFIALVGVFFVSSRRRKQDEKAPVVPPLREVAEVQEPEAMPRSDVEVPKLPEFQEPKVEEPKVEEPKTVKELTRFKSRLSEGLGRTRGALAERLSALTKRDSIDEDSWDEIEEALIRADVGVKAAMRITQKLRERKPTPQTLLPLLREQLVETLKSANSPLQVIPGQTNVWLVTGVNGVGKTTSIAKLAHRLRSEGTTTVIAAADTFRAAAIEQLGTWAERAGVHMVKHAPGADPGAVVFDAIAHAKAKQIQVLIVDTAGRIHTKTNLMEELKKVYRIAQREAGGVTEVLLVLDATVGQNGIAQAKTFQEAVDVTGVILTKLDGSARGGVVIAIQEELGIPVKAVGVGETMEDLEPFDPDAFVAALVSG